MLLHYDFSNFCSFQEKTSFSMKPGRFIKRFEDNAFQLNNHERILKTAVLVGENAGGKSNFIQSIQFLQSLFKTNSPVSTLKKYINYNESLVNNTKQRFEIEVAAADATNQFLIYKYELLIDKHSILNEKLSFKKKKTEDYQTIFEMPNKIDAKNSSSQSKFSNAVLKAWQSQKLVVILLSVLEQEEIIKPFVNWINTVLIVESPLHNSIDLYKSLKNEEEDLEIFKKDTYLEIFTLIDESITGIQIDEDKPYRDTMILRKMKNGSEFKTELNDEFSGVQEYFAWAVQLWKVVYQNKVLFADEVDRVFNPILAQRIIAFVHGSDHHGQMIFTTHNILHLNTIDFMKQQLWFIVKHRKNLNSELYSLADFPDFRYNKQMIYDWYLKGILGGAVNDTVS